MTDKTIIYIPAAAKKIISNKLRIKSKYEI